MNATCKKQSEGMIKILQLRGNIHYKWNFRKPKGAAAQKLGRLKRMREETNQIERKVIKTEPLVTESTDYHADQLVNAVRDGQLTVEQLENLIHKKLAAKWFGIINNCENV